MLAESNLRLVVSIAKHNTRIDYIGHIAAYYDALKEKKCTIFDRCYFSTYIRLSYQESKTVNECVDQIASFHYKPDLIIVLTVPKEIMEQRLVERNKDRKSTRLNSSHRT